MKSTNRLLMLITGVYSLLLSLHLVARRVFGDRFWWLSLVNTFTHLLFLPLLPLLALAAGLRNWRAALRLLPLAIFGGSRVLPRFLPKRHPLPSGTVLKVATFNVWGAHVTPPD
ncbi:MAG TPA: hypothetical protein VHO69_02625 [Phototrophicaceae bacterium]|nr:hypothetical protein [Phototrophicaceae bacterium]